MSQLDAIVKSLQSRWRAVYSEVDGEITPVADFSSIILEHKGNSFVVEKKGSVVDEGSFSVELTRNAHQIVYLYKKGPEIFLGAPRHGIFQLEGNTLKMCMSPVGHAAPKVFNTTPDAQTVLTVFQRIDAKGDFVASTVKTNVSRVRIDSQW